MSETTQIRILVLDGLDWQWVNENPQACPTLHAMARTGASARLQVCDPPLTSNAAAALLCGKEVDLGWARQTAGGNVYASSRDLIRNRPWIHELGRHGLTAALVNIPLTWPAFRVPEGSLLVSGFPIGEIDRSPWAYDGRRRVYVGDYPIEIIAGDHGPGGRRDLDVLAEAEADIVSWLLREPRRDVELIWLRATDGAGHHAWGTDLYSEIVRHADAQAARLQEGAEILVVISDHGFDDLTSPRCARYRTVAGHGDVAAQHGLTGGHTPDGIFFAAGPGLHARGLLPDQKLVEIAGGIFDLLQVPPPPGMVSAGPAWEAPYDDSAAAAIGAELGDLGYV
jgi:hypothetical protein